ncbi:response regulator [Paenibacillus chitinolyticus]|uniref:response regulator n=1 Tax=Paenibacillus chitinolyticus TaxID=79263 RepID=UPI00366EC9F6
MNVLIVDDEVIIRTGLSTVIQWEELGFRLLPAAESAEEALERVPAEHPHIVLTDIRMGGMDGITMAEKVKQMLPDSEIIVLTGYDDFAYVQQAIRGGIGDYLLKSSRPEEIIRAVMKAKQRIVSKWDARKADNMQRRAFRSRLLERLATEGIDDADSLEQVPQVLAKLGLPHLPEAAAGVCLQVLLVSVQGWGDSRAAGNLLQFAVDNMLGELLPCETLRRRDDIVVLLRAEGRDAGALRSKLGRISDKLKCVLFTAAGSRVTGLGQVPRSYREAVYTASFRGFAGTETLLAYEAVEGREGGRTVCSKEEESELAILLKNGNPIELRHFVQKALDSEIADAEATPVSLKAYSDSLVVAAHRWLERTAAALGMPQLPRLPEQDPAKRAQGDKHPGDGPGAEGQGDLQENLYLRLRVIMETYYQYVSEDGVLYIKRAIAYIQDNLDRTLTLQQVAGHVHVHPNHFSEVFKRETGVNYIEFVMRERIRRAAEILSETPVKVSEVAKKVGYEDIKYFSQLFKKYTGQTPTEFRAGREGKQ